MAINNPAIIKWAREDAALDLREAAYSLGFKDDKTKTAVEKLEAIESGEIAPSKTILEAMSSKYRKPLLTFYLKEIPQREEFAADFRKMDSYASPRQESLFRSLLLDISVRQAILVDAFSEYDDAFELPFIGLAKAIRSPNEIEKIFLQTTNFDVQKFRSSLNEMQAFGYAREIIEKLGVFVVLAANLGSHHTLLDTTVFRGFALSNKKVPFIVINQNDAKGSLVFTLFHEFIHLLLGQSVISNGNNSISIEKICDDVVGSILLGQEVLETLHITDRLSFESVIHSIESARIKLKVSYTAIAYNLYKYSYLQTSMYDEVVNYYSTKYKLNKEVQKSKSKGGPTYRTTKNYQNGRLLTSTVAEMLNHGTITLNDAGQVLGARPHIVNKLIK